MYSFMSQYDEDTPLACLTVADLKNVILSINDKGGNDAKYNRDVRYIYGLKGICDLFKCSAPTAIKYKETVIKEAVIQNGKKIMVDADLAIQLFKEWEARKQF